MKLDLGTLFEMFNQVEEEILLKEFQGPASSGEQKSTKSIPFPRLFISENWGKEGDPDRGDLELALKNAGVEITGDPIPTLKSFRQGLRQSIQSLQSKAEVENPAQILSQIIVFDTINRLFNSFQSSPLGFVNEAFLSVLYGGQQIPAQEGNEESQIGDVMVGGVPVSIKTLSPGTEIGGSINNLVQTLAKYEKVYFDIFVKRIDKKGVNGFTAYRFIVTKENAQELIPGLPPIPDAGQTQLEENNVLNEQTNLNLGDTASMKQFADDLRSIDFDPERVSEIREKWNINSITVPSDVLQNILYPASPEKYGRKLQDKETGEVTYKPVNIGGQAKDSKRWGAVEDYLLINGFIDKSERSEFRDIIMKMQSQADTLKRTTGKSVGKQFKIDQDAAIRMAQGNVVDINFSREDVDQVISVARERLQESVFSLFDKVEAFSLYITKYFTSTESNRASQFGQPAVKAAEEIKETSEEVIK